METLDILKENFITALKATNRSGVDEVISNLEALGFFTAPASSKHHLAEPSGLLRHSLNVYRQMIAVYKAQYELGNPVGDPSDPCSEIFNSISIVSLLHDICKADIYKPVIKNRKNADGKWESYKGYDCDYSAFPMGHGEKSVAMLYRWGFDLHDDEALAIRWHMANWQMGGDHESQSNFSAAVQKTPLLPCLIAADQLATWITEN